MLPFTILKISCAPKIRKRSSVIACEKLRLRAALTCAEQPTPTPHTEIPTATTIPRLLIRVATALPLTNPVKLSPFSPTLHLSSALTCTTTTNGSHFAPKSSPDEAG